MRGRGAGCNSGDTIPNCAHVRKASPSPIRSAPERGSHLFRFPTRGRFPYPVRFLRPVSRGRPCSSFPSPVRSGFAPCPRVTAVSSRRHGQCEHWEHSPTPERVEGPIPRSGASRSRRPPGHCGDSGLIPLHAAAGGGTTRADGRSGARQRWEKERAYRHQRRRPDHPSDHPLAAFRTLVARIARR